MSVASPRHHADATERLSELADDQAIDTWTVIETDDRPSSCCSTKPRPQTPSGSLAPTCGTPLGELILGSVSEDLVRDVERPMVVVGPNATTPRSGNILAVALDGSAESEAVLPAAARAVRRFHLELRLLQVATGDVPSGTTETSYLALVAARLAAPGCRDYDVLHGKDVAAHPRRLRQRP